MNMKLNVFFMGLVLSLTAQAADKGYKTIAISESIQKSLDDCQGALGIFSDKLNSDMTELLACPIVQKFELADMSDKGIEKFMKSDEVIATGNFKKVSVKKAKAMISDSVDAQISTSKDSVQETVESYHLPKEYKNAVKQLESTTSAVVAYLANIAKAGASVEADDNGYWAPSVNARVVILKNKETKTITIIAHGNTDG